VPFTQGHHIEHWADGGPTTLSNLTLLCRRHHRSVHEDNFHVERRPDGTLEFRRPDGRRLPETPPLPPVDDDIIATLRADNGLHLDGRAARGTWDGTNVDLGWAIDVMHPLAIAARGPLPTA
jgi:hypothetical protein